MKCHLNVTDHEFDKILQLTHDAVEWDTADSQVLKGIASQLGDRVVEDIQRYQVCRLEKHDDISGMPRVSPDLLGAGAVRSK